MSVGLATKWESLCLVPERSVEGLVTRRWDKGNVRKPNMNIKKALVSDVTILHDKKPQPGLNYGRIKRAPRLPLKKGKSSDSSSSSEGGEDSSCGEEEAGEQEELLGAEESGEEDKKE